MSGFVRPVHTVTVDCADPRCRLILLQDGGCQAVKSQDPHFCAYDKVPKITPLSPTFDQ